MVGCGRGSCRFDRGGIRATSCGSCALILIDRIDDVGAGLLEDHQEHAACRADRRRASGLPPGTAWPTSRTQWCAVAVGKNDIVQSSASRIWSFVAIVKLVFAVDRPLGVDGRVLTIWCEPPPATAPGGEFRRIDLNANDGLRSPNRHLRLKPAWICRARIASTDW